MTNKIQRTTVLGLGTMGHGIAQTMAVAGCEVRGYDASAEARASLHDRIHSNLKQLLAVDMIEEAAISDVLDRIAVFSSESEALDATEYVTEAVVEDLEVKQELFERIEAFVEPSAILVSNTSSFPMTEISVRMSRPERALVTHWFNPPHIVPVVEVVPGEKTTDETTQTTYDFLDRIGKLPVRLNQEIPGFLVNRVQVAMFREVFDLLDRNIASAEQIDRAIRGSAGMRLAALGPLAIIDYAGWDVTARVFQNLIPDLRSDHELPKQITDMVEAGRFGAKVGRGVFDYPPESLEQSVADRDRTYLELVKLLSKVGD